MASDRLRAILAMLNWGQRSLAEHLGINAMTCRRWATGELPVPPHVAAWLETLAADIVRRQQRAVREALHVHPLPDGWSAGPPRPRHAGDG